jgi:hypothetical protein
MYTLRLPTIAIVLNSISSGENLVTTGLQMLMLPPVQNVVAQHFVYWIAHGRIR